MQGGSEQSLAGKIWRVVSRKGGGKTWKSR